MTTFTTDEEFECFLKDYSDQWSNNPIEDQWPNNLFENQYPSDISNLTATIPIDWLDIEWPTNEVNNNPLEEKDSTSLISTSIVVPSNNACQSQLLTPTLNNKTTHESFISDTDWLINDQWVELINNIISEYNHNEGSESTQVGGTLLDSLRPRTKRLSDNVKPRIRKRPRGRPKTEVSDNLLTKRPVGRPKGSIKKRLNTHLTTTTNPTDQPSSAAQDSISIIGEQHTSPNVAAAAIEQLDARDDTIQQPVNTTDDSTQVINDDPLYKLVKRYTTTSSRFNISREVLDFDLTNKLFKNFIQAETEMREFFESLTRDYIDPLPENTKVAFYIASPSFDKPIRTKLMPKSQFNSLIIHTMLHKAIQSRSAQGKLNQLDGSKLQVGITAANLTVGSGLTAKDVYIYKRQTSIDKFAKRIRSLHLIKRDSIETNDNYCLIRAIVIGIAHLEAEDDDVSITKLLRPGNKKIRKATYKLVDTLKIPNKPLGLEYARLIEDYLKEYRIVIYGSTCRTDEPIYWNKDRSFDKYIYILHSENHYRIITSIKAYFNTSYFCDKCLARYQYIGAHSCSAICKACSRQNCIPDVEQSKCIACHIAVNNVECNRRHYEIQCTMRRICSVCKNIKGFSSHVCLNQKWCSNCKKAVDLNHKCYILTVQEEERRDKITKDKPFRGFVFYDFEAYVDPDTGNHVVNLAMANKVCKECIEIIDRDKRCIICTKKYVYHNITEFVDWLLDEENEYFIFIAHNAKGKYYQVSNMTFLNISSNEGYDAHFIINEIHKQQIPRDSDINVILSGSKIIGVGFRRIMLKDSSLFIPMPLDQFETAFELNDMNLKKGFFPHAFNKPENYDYIGPMPPQECYGIKFFNSKKLDEFKKFYQANNIFDFKNELAEYCWSDVMVLTEGCLRFSRLWREQSKINDSDPGFCPLQKKLTLASACNYLFRRKFMEPETLALTPPNGYNPKNNQSHSCYAWLTYLSVKHQIYIQHARNGGEKRMGDYYLDGYCEESKTIYEFHGCMFHGCYLCYKPESFNPILRCSHSVVRKRHDQRMHYLRNVLSKNFKDFTVCEIWEHEWKILAATEDVQKILSQCKVSEPLNPRDSLFGGRTNAFKLYHKCSENEKIKYIDYTR